MKYLVISDIHGNCDTLKKALAYKEKLGAEHILLLGDLLYHGPRNALPVPYARCQAWTDTRTVCHSL